MGIKGLTGDLRWPRLGTLRKGGPKVEKKVNGRTVQTYGVDLNDKLRFEAVDDDVAASWMAAFDGLTIPAELVVTLPYPTIDECWQAWREHWVAGGLRYRCDGENHVLWLDTETGEYRHDPVPCPGPGRCEAEPVGRLEVVIPQLQRMGTVTLLTTSLHDIRNMDGAIRVLALMLGNLTRLPVRITRVQRPISTPSKGEDGRPMRVRRHKWLLHLEAAPAALARMLADGAATAPLLAAAPTGPGALPAPYGAGEGDVDAVALSTALPPPADDFGGDVSWTALIAAADTLDDLVVMRPEIQAIDQVTRKANVDRLWWTRVVEIVIRDSSGAGTEELERLAKALQAAPAGTPHLEDARSFLGIRRDELIEAGKLAPSDRALQPALS